MPDVVLALSHPYDFYFHEVERFHPAGLERMALSRNATRAFDYYERMIAELKRQGYELVFVSEALDDIQSNTELQELALTDWK